MGGCQRKSTDFHSVRTLHISPFGWSTQATGCCSDECDINNGRAKKTTLKKYKIFSLGFLRSESKYLISSFWNFLVDFSSVIFSQRGASPNEFDLCLSFSSFRLFVCWEFALTSHEQWPIHQIDCLIDEKCGGNFHVLIFMPRVFIWQSGRHSEPHIEFNNAGHLGRSNIWRGNEAGEGPFSEWRRLFEKQIRICRESFKHLRTGIRCETGMEFSNSIQTIQSQRFGWQQIQRSSNWRPLQAQWHCSSAQWRHSQWNGETMNFIERCSE